MFEQNSSTCSSKSSDGNKEIKEEKDKQVKRVLKWTRHLIVPISKENTWPFFALLFQLDFFFKGWCHLHSRKALKVTKAVSPNQGLQTQASAYLLSPVVSALLRAAQDPRPLCLSPPPWRWILRNLQPPISCHLHPAVLALIRAARGPHPLCHLPLLWRRILHPPTSRLTPAPTWVLETRLPLTGPKAPWRPWWGIPGGMEMGRPGPPPSPQVTSWEAPSLTNHDMTRWKQCCLI